MSISLTSFLSGTGTAVVNANTTSMTWQLREELRFASGHYKPLPWANKLKPIEGHYAHISVKDPNLVAYTESREKGERDIQAPMKPGRYLKQFYPDLSASEITALQALLGTATDVKFATDPDEIEKIYSEGPTSCMAGPNAGMGSQVSGHPARCYGGGDLAVAYLTNKKGQCNARSVVWPEKKLYYLVYGDSRLTNRLQELGYRAGGSWCFQGAKLKRQPNTARPGSVLMACVDGHGIFSLADDEHLIIDRNGHLQWSGHGYMDVPTPVVCGCGCGKKGDPKTMGPVWPSKDNKEQRWQVACRDAAYKAKTLAYCHASGAYVHPDNLGTGVDKVSSR